MRITVHPSSREAASSAAEELVAQAAGGGLHVLGVATGSTPQPLYRELAKHRTPGLADLTLFALDEYVGLPEGHPQSYRSVIERDVGEPLGISPSRIHLPDPVAPGAYDAAIAAHGGIDVQILGIGQNGHIGFNEPGSGFHSLTRVTPLDASTRAANARFFDSIEDVPTHAVTQGIATILSARRIVVFAFGRAKADAVAAAISGPRTEQMPASALQDHPDVSWVIDEDAASLLPPALRSNLGRAVELGASL
ncbi:glucosamine-6-phosphate deaminase [Microbacterium sp.]|uniref:glucosamine-6-phosphate deaminase n=1 Tax=Microbacterium sp. TaxID=51671 RepID=UPI003F976EF0